MYCDWPLLGRCCFCMPLRKGVLTFGCIHFVFSLIMIIMYSCFTIEAERANALITGRYLMMPMGLSLAFYCFEIFFDGLLIYGAYKNAVPFLKAFYGYTMVSSGALLVLQIMDITETPINAFEEILAIVAGLLLQIYLIILVHSLIRKMEISDMHQVTNKLHEVVVGDIPANENTIYYQTTSEH